jgi:hypothetical protein
LHHERADVRSAHEVRGALALPDELGATDGNAGRSQIADERGREIERRASCELGG